ncbi:MAG: HAD-IIIA family hydrolase [Bacteroidetes bacterium]|nr:HAD-IIIA family hydrolase [Bacteroidota bacterium]
MVNYLNNISLELIEKARKIKLLLSDCDGVLTDTGVYYTKDGEEMKRFSHRDGMGVERLRELADVETGFITGENSDFVKRRAEKLKIEELHMGIKDKVEVFNSIMERLNLRPEEIAFIGDDTNDVEIMKLAGLTACPNDATPFAKEVADIVVESNGGFGALRDFAEIIIESKTK